MGTLVPIGLPEISAGSDRLRELKTRIARSAAQPAKHRSPHPGGSLAIRGGRLRARTTGETPRW
jgi:hypothetical protein